MRLLRLHIENFGKLHDFALEFEAGLQVLHHENGWGKSTLAVFIKAMLFGLPATTKRSLDENERKKYTPWQGGAYGGSIEFESAKGCFRAERFFGAKESGDTFALFDLATNRPSNAYTASLGAELFGIDAGGFERSTYLSQNVYDIKSGNAEISAKLSNLLDDVDDIGSYDDAWALLDKRRKHYVTTGNRGEVSLLEQQIPEKQRELEDCLRKEEARLEQATRLAEMKEEIAALEISLGETRANLKQAALSRENAAHLERKNSMLEELRELAEQKQTLRAFFHGFPPTKQEMDQYTDLYERQREAKARLGAIPTQPSEPQERARLAKEYPAGLPTEAELEQAVRESGELQRIGARIDALIRVRDSDGEGARFAKGLPEPRAMEDAKAALDRADKLSQAAETLRRERRLHEQTSPLAIPAWLLFLVGGVGIVLSFVLSSMKMPLLVGGGVLALIGVVLVVLVGVRQGKQRSLLADIDERLAKWDAQIDGEMGGVKAFLTRFGMPTAEPSRALTELWILCEQHRERQSHRHSIHEELRGLESRRRALIQSLGELLGRYRISLGENSDYRPLLDRLGRDRELLTRLEAEERKRRFDYASAKAALEDLQGKLEPILRRFDPKGERKASECLALVNERREDYNRICKDMTRRENELKAFIAEKKLDGLTVTDPHLFAQLSERETELQKKLGELQRQKTTLKGSIDRLSADTDRLPELEAELARLRERLLEAKSNHATLTKTITFLEEAKNALSTRYLGPMQKSLAQNLSTLVGEDAPESMVDDRFDVLLTGGGKARTMESFSRGWRDAVQFCIRLSLTDALYAEGEKPFLLLDDPFVNLDDVRLHAALRMTRELAKRYQVIYLACRKDSV